MNKSPHYAFLNAKNNITWVSKDHIYFESVCNKNECLSEEHYIITGAQYRNNLKPSLVERFQAVYLRNDKDLPGFVSIPEKVNKAKTFYLFIRRLVKLAGELTGHHS